MHVFFDASVTQSRHHCPGDWSVYLSWCVSFTSVYFERYSNIAEQMLSNVLTASHHRIINHLKNMLGSESSVWSRVNFVQLSSHNLPPKGNLNEASLFFPRWKPAKYLICCFARRTPGIDDCVTE